MNAIFTIQHNEEFYLPKWVKYYSLHFKPEDMYILSHNCSGKTLELLKDYEKQGYNIEYLETNEIFNHDWLTNTVHKKQQELLKKYKYVVFTDCDEFIFPDNLKDFLDNATEKAYRCEGFEVIGNKVYPNPRFMNKTLITSIPLEYEHGYHSASPEFPVCQSLPMFHIHRINYREALERNKRLAQEKWDNKAISQNMGRQNCLIDIEAFNKWYFECPNPTRSAQYDKLSRIINKVSIVSAYYNKEELTKDFLDNLQKVTPDVEMILVNADSKPIEHSFISKRIDLDRNESFANSMNAGLVQATGDYVCLIGNDVFPKIGWLDSLIELADRTQAYITAPLNNQTNLASYTNDKGDYIETKMFPAVCWLLSRECLDKIGAFDEQFKPGCYEDNDYCKRVELAGGKVVIDKKTTVNHLVSQTISQFSVSQMMKDNFQRYVNKWS